MRYIALVFVLIAASWFAPMVQMPERDLAISPSVVSPSAVSPLAVEPIETSALASEALGWRAVAPLIEAGRDTLVFTVAPSEITQPILPDIPEPIAQITPDQPPLRLTDIATVAWTEGPALASLQRVTAVMLNIRSAPSPTASVVASLEQGDWATIMGAGQSGWVPIRARVGGAEGWVFKRYLAPVEG